MFQFARIEEQPGDIDAVHVGGGHGCGAVGGLQRGEAQAHHHRVGTRDADGFGEVVDARREEQVLARLRAAR